MSEFPFDTETELEPSWPPWYKSEEPVGASLDKETVREIVVKAFDLIAESYPRYQRRDSQLLMACRILDHFLNHNIFILEAGTGIGKSFAYLVAAIAYSYLSGEKAVISTETKNLQMQLMEKDLPQLQKILDPSLTFELALGSGNYLCRLRHEESFTTGSFRDMLSKEDEESYREWSRDVFEKGLQGHMYESKANYPWAFWSLVNRDPDGCPSNRCVFFSQCNYYRVKRLWTASRILVANHHLFLFNLINEKRTLPAYGAAVFDEAHGFLETAHSIFTLKFTSETIRDLKKLFDKAMGKTLPGEAQEDWGDIWKHAIENWDVFFSNWEVELGLSFEENKSKVITEVTSSDLSETTKSLSAILENVQVVLDETEDSTLLNRLNAVKKISAKAIRFVKYYSEMSSENLVYWGEKKEGRFYLYTCNLNVGDELAQLMDEAQVWTSATLGYWSHGWSPETKKELLDQGYFNQFIEEVIGKENIRQVETDYFRSPFDYAKNSVIYAPVHLKTPEWKAPAEAKERFEIDLAEEIASLVRLSKGGALVLFTSNYMLRRVHELLEEMVGFEIISQLDVGASEALERFKADPDSVLLGSASFWQGVDVVGHGLRMLVITRLMFQPPDDPILQARSRILEEKNESPFFKISVPRASMMLRQAFGRLIRSEDDKGAVAVLDNRLIEKSYGKYLLSNLPGVPRVTTMERLKERVEEHGLFDPPIESDKL